MWKNLRKWIVIAIDISESGLSDVADWKLMRDKTWIQIPRYEDKNNIIILKAPGRLVSFQVNNLMDQREIVHKNPVSKCTYHNGKPESDPRKFFYH